MTPEEILKAFAEAEKYKYPGEAVREAVARQEEMTPVLLQALDTSIAQYKKGELMEIGDWLTPNIAVYLLAAYRETAAHERIIELFSMKERELEWMWSDAIAQDGASLLLSTYPGDPSALQRVIESEKTDEFVRSQALMALHGAVSLLLWKEEALAGYLTSLFRGRIQRVEGALWNQVVCIAADLRLMHLEPDINRAYDEELCDEMFMDQESVIRVLHGEKPWPYYEPDIPSVMTEVEGVIARWGYFRKREPFKPVKLPKLKIGRNDPCTCGSGKKYKKCCGVGA